LISTFNALSKVLLLCKQSYFSLAPNGTLTEIMIVGCHSVASPPLPQALSFTLMKKADN